MMMTSYEISAEAAIRNYLTLLRERGIDVAKVEEAVGSDGYHQYRVITVHIKSRDDEVGLKAFDIARAVGLKATYSRRSKKKPPRISIYTPAR